MSNNPIPIEKKMEASAMWMEGLPISEIARRMKIPKNSVSGMANRNRRLFPTRGNPIKGLLSGATYDGDPVQRAQEMWMLGATQLDIRREIGVTQGCIHEAIKSHPELSPPRETVRSAPEPVKITLPPLACVSDPVPDMKPPAIRPYVVGVRLPPVLPTGIVADMAEAQPAVVFKPRKPRQCCWPLWGMGRPTHVYCDGTAREGRPYCAEHSRLAYVKVRDRREDAA